ncbi:DUF6503 family protein [Ichthyenterobacterium sp. W332]|uniref:DUF6503 family protein n=1 Tax=Microcosmobacter mediterraneus TaxID=3075607 RepID=A0ABU2YK12_9FLAO|nr:DUF6503 family protein [Ichthyenterobacterium sp. W332]MDT0557560.1 DUF6503 family protein [Ichthyenterobacterium sp. W332]
MRRVLSLFSLLLVITSCKDKPVQSPVDYKEEPAEITTSIYPETISKIMKAHGGLDAWTKANTLVFAMENPEGIETTTTDLKSRKSLIETEAFKIGFDGTNVWLDQDTEVYKGNPKFYYNLMFYFYAMPFVLADDGITYTETEPLVFEGKSYPGINISYGEGVGESPDDEYVLYYNPETYKMEWLGYTVTYFSKEKSKDWHFIKYHEWETLQGLKLPKTLQWYNNDGFEIKDMRNAAEFINTSVNVNANDDMFYAKPERAKIIE